MATATSCQTPGATYGIEISPMLIACCVALDKPLRLSKAQAEQLEANLHNAVELVLARYFPEPETHRPRCASGFCVFGFGPTCTRCGEGPQQRPEALSEAQTDNLLLEATEELRTPQNECGCSFLYECDGSCRRMPPP